MLDDGLSLLIKGLYYFNLIIIEIGKESKNNYYYRSYKLFGCTASNLALDVILKSRILNMLLFSEFHSYMILLESIIYAKVLSLI